MWCPLLFCLFVIHDRQHRPLTLLRHLLCSTLPETVRGNLVITTALAWPWQIRVGPTSIVGSLHTAVEDGHAGSLRNDVYGGTSARLPPTTHVIRAAPIAKEVPAADSTCQRRGLLCRSPAGRQLLRCPTIIGVNNTHGGIGMFGPSGERRTLNHVKSASAAPVAGYL